MAVTRQRTYGNPYTSKTVYTIFGNFMGVAYCISYMERGSQPVQNPDGGYDTARASQNRMSTHTRTSNQSAGTHREYRFRDSHDSAVVVPDSWAQAGNKETGEGERFFAVEVRLGRRFEYTVDRHGDAVAGPHTDEPGIQTLYVSSDGGRAVVVESRAVRVGDGLEPHNEWRSVLSDPTAELSPVTPERRDAYRSLIRDLYPNEVGN